MIKFLILILIIISGCSTIATKGKLGQCIRHKYQNGTFKIVKVDDSKIIAELQTKNIDEQKLIEIGHLYGGWVQEPCPKDIKMPFK